MTLRERTTTTVYMGMWQAMCQEDDCRWLPPEGATSRNPKFRSARRHADDTGHLVIIRHVMEWEITRKEEADATLRNH